VSSWGGLWPGVAVYSFPPTGILYRFD
jgi:hypothetical protein